MNLNIRESINRVNNIVNGIGFCDIQDWSVKNNVAKIIIDYEEQGTPARRTLENITMAAMAPIGIRVMSKKRNIRNNKYVFKILIMG